MKTKLLIFGITGDLSVRKLLPSLEHVVATGDFDDLEVIGVSRREVDVSELLHRSVGDDCSLVDRVSIFTMNLAEATDYDRLAQHLALQADEQLLIYLAVPPAAAGQIVSFMGQAGLNSDNVKLMFEKPFGVDLKSAESIIERTAQYFDEEQIYRIDHYLAKDMAQNIVTFRGRNAIFSHLWHSDAIEKIEILALEKIGIENRAQFYEQTGALRDFVQGHLMQLLALTLMEIPDNFDWTQLPELRMDVLRQMKAADPTTALRAQYNGYADEVENAGSETETFAQVELRSDDPAWRDVPIVLTTGKALNEKLSEIRVHFKKVRDSQSNCLTFRIQPNEGIVIDLFTKKPGYDRQFEAQKMAFGYPPDTRLPDAYEQVIVDAIRSHKSLFASSDEIIRSWQILQPLLDNWASNQTKLCTYPKGSSPEDVAVCAAEQTE